jgi:glutamine synthetase
MYIKMVQIEARVIGDLALNHIIPTAIKYQNNLLENVKGLKEVLSVGDFNKKAAYQMELIKEISDHIHTIQHNVTKLVEERKKANVIEDVKEKSFMYCDEVKPYFEVIRYHADKLETLIDDELWPLPKYRELLFIK